MALAILRFEEADGDTAHFQADIGHNRFYRYQIGDGAARDSGGFARLANPSHESELLGPLRPSALGRARIDIPLALFGRRARFVQLLSYGRPPDVGPAISDIVELPFGQLPRDLPADDDERRPRAADDERPGRRRAPNESGSLAMSQYTGTTPRTPINVRANGGGNGYGPARALSHPDGGGPYAAPFAYREAKYSEAMFLQAIGSLLSSALPAITKVIGGLGGAQGIGNLLGGLLGGGGAAAPAAPANPSGANSQSITPDLAKQIMELLRVLAPQPAAAPAKAAASSLAQPFSGYSQQMIAPALLAALPALMPLLEKVMNPETMNAIGNNFGPKASIGAVSDAIKNVGGLNVQAHQNVLDHIAKIMPSNDTTSLQNLLLAINQSLAAPTILPAYRRIDGVALHFAPQAPVMLRGREQAVYLAGAPGGLAFPLTIDTPRPIRRATLYLLVKELETLRVVAQKQWDVTGVGPGPLAEVPRLPAGETGGLAAGGDYLVGVYLVWQTKRGETIGVSRSQAVHITGAYAYQGVEAEGEIVPLNDVDKFRPYWHKVWQTTFTREARRWEWDCKYYYVPHAEGGRSERLETVTEETPGGGRRVEGRLKSGLRLSLADLNALLPQISAHPSLNARQLQALSAPAALAAFGRSARSKAEFRGAEGDSVALWIYPEMRLQPIVLLRAGAPDANGLVTEMTEETVHFPIPALAHFVGVTTEKDPFPALNEPVEI